MIDFNHAVASWSHARSAARAVSAGLALFSALAVAGPARAGQAWGSINNFDCVNDTGQIAYGCDIELDDTKTTDITYTYDWNHYGVPKITNVTTDVAHPKVLVRYAATWNGTAWQPATALTIVPTGPISPTQGHQFTDPSVNFGGEHFGVGFVNTPTAVRYYWLTDAGGGKLVRGPLVSIATPVFSPAPPVNAPIAVQAVIVPPPPPVPPVNIQFGDAMWVKEIKTTAHNANKVHLNDLVGDDPGLPQPWANGENPEVEMEWKLMQTEFGAPGGGPNGELAGAPEDLPGGDEVVTRRYEFYKYIGPFDAETGQAMADALGPDGIHGAGTVTYADHFDWNTGEWVTVTVDLSTVEVVGDFFGAQMSAIDVQPAMGLIDNIQDGDVNVAYPDRRVVIAGPNPFVASVSAGSLPDGLTLDISGVLSGTPSKAGVFTFTVKADDGSAILTKDYTVTISGPAAPATYTISTSVSPAGSGTTTGGAVYNSGDMVNLTASPNPGFTFVNWTEGGAEVCTSGSYTFTASADRALVANFTPVTYKITTSESPAIGGTTSGGNTYNYGSNVTVSATANSGYRFVNWTEAGVEVSATPDYTFTASADRSLVANFVQTFTVSTSASPAGYGTTSGDGTFDTGTPVTVVASRNAGYHFVRWTEGGNTVSTTASYTFNTGADRSLVAEFAVDTPALSITSATAVSAAKGNKVDVTVTIANSGTADAQGVTIASKKDATLGGKQANSGAPAALGNIPIGGSVSVTLTFAGIKAGTQPLQVTLTYGGKTVTLNASVVVP